jgi:flagellar basal-body rod protein FlgF
MIKGIYTSSSAMRAGVLRQDITANNLANANTTGFKRDRLFVHDLISADNDKASAAATPVSASRWTEFTAGAFNPTGGLLDFALQGKGFFVVSDGSKEYYTRNGHFERNSGGQLVDPLGRVVQGEGGPISLPQGAIALSARGEISINGLPVDKLRIVDFEDLQSLQKTEGSSFVKTAISAAETPVESPVIRQGFLESSNVETVAEMVEMISTARNYEINAKLLTTQDDSLRHTVGELGKV